MLKKLSLPLLVVITAIDIIYLVLFVIPQTRHSFFDSNLAALGTLSTPTQSWYAEYYDYPATHSDMNPSVPTNWQPNTDSRYDGKPGDPLNTAWQEDWFNPSYALTKQIIPTTAIGSFFPLDALGAKPTGSNHRHYFGAHFNAKVTVPVENDYTFRLEANDDGYVYLDKQLIISSPGITDAISVLAPQERKIRLKPNQTYIVDIYYAQRDNRDNRLTFAINAPLGQPTPTIKACGTANLPETCENTDYLVQYYDYTATTTGMELSSSVLPDRITNSDPMHSFSKPWFTQQYFVATTTATSSRFNPFFPLDYLGNTPGQIHNFHFGARFNGQVEVKEEGDYKYVLDGDDDTWLFIDGKLIKNRSGVYLNGGNPESSNGIIHFRAGQKYTIDIFFAERHTSNSLLDFRFATKGVTVTNCFPNLCGVVDPTKVPPQVQVVWPEEGSVLSGTQTIQAIASDNVGLKEVQFYVDGKAVGGAVAAKAANKTAANQCVVTPPDDFNGINFKLYRSLNSDPVPVKIAMDNLRGWTFIDPNHTVPPSGFGRQGDEKNVRSIISFLQVADNSLPVAPGGIAHHSGPGVFDWLNKNFLDQPDYPIMYPALLTFWFYDLAGVNQGAHSTIIYSAKRTGRQTANGTTEWALGLIDPNGPKVYFNDPGAPEKLLCWENNANNTDFGVICRIPGYGLAAVPVVYVNDEYVTRKFIEALNKKCAPNGVPNYEGSCGPFLRGTNREALIYQLLLGETSLGDNLDEFNGLPTFGNFSSETSARGNCFGYNDLVLRTAYLADFVGMPCVGATDSQNINTILNTDSLTTTLSSAVSSHSIYAVAKDINGQTTKSDTVTFLVKNPSDRLYDWPASSIPSLPLGSILNCLSSGECAVTVGTAVSGQNLSLKKPLTLKTGAANIQNYCRVTTPAGATDSCCNKPGTTCPGFSKATSNIEPDDWKANDGNPQTMWCSKQLSGAGDSDWAYVDLGKSETIAKVVILQGTSTVPVGSSGSPLSPYACGQSADSQIQVSNDKITWTTVATKIGDTSALKTYTLATPATGRYVRFLGTKLNARRLSIREFEVWNTKDAVSTLSLTFNQGPLTSSTQPLTTTVTQPATTTVPKTITVEPTPVAVTPTPAASSESPTYLGPIINYGAGQASHRVSLQFQATKGKLTNVSLVSGYNTCYATNVGGVNLCKPGEYAPNSTCQVYLQRTVNAATSSRCVLQMSYTKKDNTIQNKFYESFGAPNIEQIKEISDPRQSSWWGDFKQAVANVLWGW